MFNQTYMSLLVYLYAGKHGYHDEKLGCGPSSPRFFCVSMGGDRHFLSQEQQKADAKQKACLFDSWLDCCHKNRKIVVITQEAQNVWRLSKIHPMIVKPCASWEFLGGWCICNCETLRDFEAREIGLRPGLMADDRAHIRNQLARHVRFLWLKQHGCFLGHLRAWFRMLSSADPDAPNARAWYERQHKMLSFLDQASKVSPLGHIGPLFNDPSMQTMCLKWNPADSVDLHRKPLEFPWRSWGFWGACFSHQSLEIGWNIWWFPEIGVAPNHVHFLDGIFPEINHPANSSYGGTPTTMETPIFYIHTVLPHFAVAGHLWQGRHKQRDHFQGDFWGKFVVSSGFYVALYRAIMWIYGP